MDADKRAQFVEALSIVSDAQLAIMQCLSYLATENSDILPSIYDAVDKYSEWLASMHAVMVEAEPYVPRVIVQVPPLNLDVL